MQYAYIDGFLLQVVFKLCKGNYTRAHFPDGILLTVLVMMDAGIYYRLNMNARYSGHWLYNWRASPHGRIACDCNPKWVVNTGTGVRIWQSLNCLQHDVVSFSSSNICKSKCELGWYNRDTEWVQPLYTQLDCALRAIITI